MRVIKKGIMLLIAAAMIISGAGCGVSSATSSAAANMNGIVISEVVSSNSNSCIDPVFGRPDWIEIGNLSDKAIDLSGYSISTSKSSDRAYALPKITLDAGKYILLFCSNAIENMPKDKYCTGFKLSKTGTTLVLSYNEGIIQRLNVPQLETDISYGIAKDGTYKYFAQATPGEANSTDPYLTLAEIESAKTAELQITEVLPKSISDTDPYGWVEIQNAGKSDIKLSDYYITEDLSNPTKCRLPEKTLKSGEYAVLKFTGGTGADELAFKVGGQEASLMISNNFGAPVDTFSWDPAILPGISAGKGGDGAAQYFEKPTPGAQNGSDALAKVDFTIKEGNLPVRINEVLKDNTFSMVDADGDRSAWVELYNTTDQNISLSQYALTDTKDDLWKFILPNVEIAPNSYKVIFLSGKDRKTGDEIHASFKLGNADKQLILTCRQERAMQAVNLPEKNKDNVSYGLDDGGQWVYFPQPTPDAANSTEGKKDIASIQDTVSPLRINEVMATNTAKGKKNDWVEIYNQSSEDINLKGYFLSDTQKDLKKWPIGDLKAPANGYAVINGNLSISSNGERLFLSDPQGVIIDQYETGLLRSNISSGLTGDKELKRVFFQGGGTPGKPNTGETAQGYAQEPLFSEPGGYKDKAFSLEMKTATPNAKIYYTLDGSTPTSGSIEYSGPVSIPANTVTVRAIAIAPGMLNSDEMVATYIFGVKHKLPVICLSMTKSDFTWVCGSSSRENKREKGGYVEYYEADGKLGVRFPAGFSIAGNGTRSYAQKSINIYLRGIYGRSSVTYPFFDDYKITNFKSLSLRNMGQDADSRMRDLYSGMVMNGMNIDNMQGKFAVVYINGDYWGLYEFKENQNEDYFASRYGVDPDKLDMIRGGVYAITGTNKDVKYMYQMSKKNTNDSEIFKEYSEKADSALTMDYIIAQTYLYGVDKYNQKLVRSQDYKMKWHPLLYDLDMTMGNVGGNAFGIYFTSGESYGPLHEDGTRQRIYMELYYGFYKNDEWKQQFVKRYAEVLNTILTPDKTLALFESMADSIKDEMPRTIERWHNPSSMSSWNNQLNQIRNFLKNRRKVIINQLQERFNLSEAQVKELFPNG